MRERSLQMIQLVADQRGIGMATLYNEKRAADILDVDYTTLKRWRRANKIRSVPYGDGVRYLGLHLIKFIIAGTDSVSWDDTSSGSSASVSGSSDSVPEALPSTGAGSTPRSDGPTASASARSIFGKPAKG